jgi:hypothetical protein
LELVSKAEVESSTTLGSTHEDVEGLARKVALLKDDLATKHRVREEFEMEHQVHFEEFTLLQTRVSELCHAIVCPPHAKHQLSEGMWLVALHHTEMVGELATFRATVSSTTESVLECSPGDTARAEVVGELVTEFQKVEGQCSRLERPATWIYDLLLGPPLSRVRMADRLDEAAGQHRAELAARREAEVVLEAL